MNLEDAVQKDAVDKLMLGANDVGKMLVIESQEVVPFKEGLLHDNIQYKVEKEGEDVIIKIGVSLSKVPYAKIQEEGSRDMVKLGHVGTPSSPYKYKTNNPAAPMPRVKWRPFLAGTIFAKDSKIREIFRNAFGG